METVEDNTILEEKERSFWLSAFLIIMFITNPLTAISYFSYPEGIAQIYPLLSIPIIYFMGILAILNTILVVVIWT